MTAVALENVDVAEILSRKESRELVERFEAALSQDAEAARIMENATGIEDMYKVASRYVEMKLEDFKAVCHKTISYLAEAKTRLADDDMDCVVGGGVFDWIKKQWDNIVSIVAGVAVTAAGGAMICAGIVASAFGAVPVGVAAGAAGIGISTVGGFAIYQGVDGIVNG